MSMRPIKMSCSLCGDDWDGHDHCPVEREWEMTLGFLWFAISFLVGVLAFALVIVR